MKTALRWQSCKRLIWSSLLLSSPYWVSGQISTYSFSTTYGTYVADSTGTIIIPVSTDEALTSPLSIGFSFTYNCNVYTRFMVSSNGWMSLGSLATGPLPLNALATVGQGPILAPLWDDLAVSDSIPANVNYQLTGTAPNRVLTVEWLYMKWNAAAPGPVMSFQVKLYETSNIVQFVYERESNTIWYGSASVGITNGTDSTDFFSVWGPAYAPVNIYGIANDTVRTRPRGGRIYQWAPTKSCPLPGGVTGAAFWVEANAGVLTPADGTALPNWYDQSGNIRNAVSPGSANNPVYRDNSTDNINFNPIVAFNDAGQNAAVASFMDIPGNGALAAGNTPYAVYAVVKPGAANLSTPGKFLFGGTSGTNNSNAFDVHSSNALGDIWGANDLSANASWTVGYPSLASFSFNATQRQIFINGATAATLAGSARSSADTNDALGCLRATVPATQFYDGGLAEVVTYPNTTHSGALRKRIESYLALKYGITLNHNYTSSTGAIVWNTATDAAYNTNITGIAQDGNSGLLQRQSKSSSLTADLLTVYIGPAKTVNQANNTGVFAAGDQSFFIAANNNAPILFPYGTPVTGTPPGICCRLERQWLSQITNFTNTDLTLEFDFNVVTPGYSPLNPADLRLLVDDDGNFTNALVLGSPAVTISVSASVVTVNVPASSFAGRPYFTLGSVSPATALPVQTGNFTAACANNAVQLGWTKLSGSPNSFTIERSSDGMHFAALGTVQSEVTGMQVFVYNDPSPLPGIDYYRLRITDQTAIVTYSDIVTVSGCSPGGMRIAADPATGQFTLFVYLVQNAAVDINLYDMTGRRFEVPGLTGHRAMQQGYYQLPVTGRSLSRGVYVLSVLVNGNNNVFRVLQP